MKLVEWLDKMNYPVDKIAFQNEKITFDFVMGNPHFGRCLVVNVPTTNGSNLQAIIMKECEKKEIKDEVKMLCKKYKPKRVLEVGFGLGYTATQFQEYGIEKHTIVEAHPQMFKAAKKWKENYPNKNIEIIFKFFQDYTYNETDFDLIYDDRYEIIDRDRSYLEMLGDNGFVFRNKIKQFPCWKVI